MNIDLILHILIIIGLIIGTTVWIIYWSKADRHKRNYAIAPILFGINALIYSILTGFNILSKQFYLLWGDVVSIHGIIIVITIGIMLIQFSEGGKN